MKLIFHFKILLWIFLCKIEIIGSSHPSYKPVEGQSYKSYSKDDVPFRTTWPLQVGFPGAKITNLNKYLDIFSNCLVNVQNFHGIELLEWNFPIHLSRFDITGTFTYTTDKRFSTMSKHFLFEKVPKLRDLTNATTWTEVEPISYKDALKYKWSCYAQFDLFHPEIKDAFHFYLHRMAYNWKESFILHPNFGGPLVTTFDKYQIPKPFGDHTRPTYFLLVTHLNTSRETKDFWLYGKTQSTFNEHTSKFFYLFTENFKETEERHLNCFPQELPISSFKFVCLTCCTCKKVLIPLELKSWEKTVSNFSQPGRVPWIVNDYVSAIEEDQDTLSPRMYGFLDKTETKNSFRQFLGNPTKLKNLPDIFLTRDLLPNVSFISGTPSFETLKANQLQSKTCLIEFPAESVENFCHYSHYAVPGQRDCFFSTLSLRSEDQVAVIRNQDEFTFLSCGTPKREKPSIAGLFSSFDKATWICLVAFILIWPVTLSLIENNFNYRLVLVDSQTWLLGLILLLEQGHYLATNSKKRGPLYYMCGLTLLVLIVVSNAYKGDNILALTKLLQVIPYTNFKLLLNGGMNLLSLTVVKSSILLPYIFLNVTEFDEAVESFGWQLSAQKIKDVESALKMHPLGAKAYLDLTAVSSFSTIMDECSGIALFGWNKDLLSPIAQSLHKNDSHEGQVFLGTEIFFRKYLGWTLVGWMDERLPQRIAYMRDSGIFAEWISIQERNLTTSSFKPYSLNLKGNVIVQFYCLAGGLILSMVGFLIEVRKTGFTWIFRCFKYISRMAFHSSKQLYEVFLFGVNVGNKTLNYQWGNFSLWSHFPNYYNYG